MVRSIWKGSIAFGLVNILVELHTAVRENRPKFRMLHAADKSPVAKIILRDTEHLCAVEAIEDALVLTMMRFEEAVVDISSFEFPSKAEARAKGPAARKSKVA